MAVQHGGVAGEDLATVLQNDDLRIEGSRWEKRVVIGVRASVPTLDILDGNVLEIETDVVTCLFDDFEVHFNGLDVEGSRGESEIVLESEQTLPRSGDKRATHGGLGEGDREQISGDEPTSPSPAYRRRDKTTSRRALGVNCPH